MNDRNLPHGLMFDGVVDIDITLLDRSAFGIPDIGDLVFLLSNGTRNAVDGFLPRIGYKVTTAESPGHVTLVRGNNAITIRKEELGKSFVIGHELISEIKRHLDILLGSPK